LSKLTGEHALVFPNPHTGAYLDKAGDRAVQARAQDGTAAGHAPVPRSQAFGTLVAAQGMPTRTLQE
jgi:hypothetical protein